MDIDYTYLLAENTSEASKLQLEIILKHSAQRSRMAGLLLRINMLIDEVNQLKVDCDIV